MKSLTSFVARRRNILKKCLVLIGPETKRQWLGLILLAIFVSGLEAVAAVLILVLLAVVSGPESSTVLPVIGDLHERFPDLAKPRGLMIASIVIGCFFIVRAVAYLFQSYLQNRVAYNTSALLAKRLLHGYLAMPYLAYVSRNSAELIRNAHQSTLSLAAWVLFPGILLASEVFVVLALSTVLILSSPLVAAGTFMFLGVIVILLLKLVQPRLLGLGRLTQDLTTESLKTLQQTLLGLRDIRMLGREEFFEEEFGRTRQRLARTYSVQGLLIDVPRVSLETSVLVALLLFIALQAISGNPVSESTTLLGMFGYAALRVLPSTNRLVNTLQSLKFAGPLIDSLYTDVVAIEEQARTGPAPSETLDFRMMELRNVTFRYPDSPHDALSKIQLTVSRGESIGIVGHTGSGKSTLLDLFLGLIDPTDGEIYIDGVPLHERRTSWQRSIGLVPQTVFLLDDTIRRNVALGLMDEHINEALLAEAIETAQLAEFVGTLPAGLETVVGERGVKLSGGQRQRIAIARAIYTQAKVLAFDEGTSALDGNTESQVLDNLSRLRDDITVINVAHRLSTIRRCDRIVLITQGRIADSGTFDELVARNEEFESLTRGYFESSDKAVDASGEPKHRPEL